jgi:hypothetical protein
MPADLAKESRPSYFQGFAIALFPDYLQIFEALIEFPHDAMELFLTGSDFLQSKMAGSSLDVYMVRADLIDDKHIDLERSLNVIWSSAESVELVESRLNQFKVRPLHITVGDRSGVVPLSSLTSKSTNRHVLELISRAATTNTKLSAFFASISKRVPKLRDEGPLPFTPSLHNCTVPLIKVLQLYGYRIEGGSSVKPSSEIDQHVEGMLQLARAIDELRHSVGTPSDLQKNDAILFCPSTYTYLYRADSRHWNELYRKLDRDRRKFIKTFLIRNRGYGNSPIQLTSMFDPYKDNLVGPLVVMRQVELGLFTSIIALAAANQFVPALRLPNSVMLHHDRLKNIYALVNSNGRDRTLELNRKVMSYSHVIQEEMGSELVKEAFGSRKKLLTVCDFPIEWLSINLVPAMFRYEMSRIPSTPGNVTAHVLLSGQRVIMPLSILANILIIRSLETNDPIHNHLSDSVNHFVENSDLQNLSLKLVDVASEAELVDALNSFQGVIVIFDCHGNHGGEESHAWLHIGQDKVDVWQLANRARVPPIVILGACSTHALDGSHASVANGFLRSGAVSVIGTFAPVGAIHTGIFIARLLYRISAFIPLATMHMPRSWREIVSGFFRMSYVTDVLMDLLHEVRAISDVQYRQIHIDANMWINSGDPAWIDNLFASVMSATRMSKDAVHDLWTQRYQFVETMLLVQLGHPENILIINDIAEDTKEKVDMAVNGQQVSAVDA